MCGRFNVVNKIAPKERKLFNTPFEVNQNAPSLKHHNYNSGLFDLPNMK
jgi:hypothetical protein